MSSQIPAFIQVKLPVTFFPVCFFVCKTSEPHPGPTTEPRARSRHQQQEAAACFLSGRRSASPLIRRVQPQIRRDERVGGVGGRLGKVSSISPEEGQRQKTIPSTQPSFTLCRAPHLTPTRGSGWRWTHSTHKNIHNDVELFCKRESPAQLSSVATAPWCLAPGITQDEDPVPQLTKQTKQRKQKNINTRDLTRQGGDNAISRLANQTKLEGGVRGEGVSADSESVHKGETPRCQCANNPRDLSLLIIQRREQNNGRNALQNRRRVLLSRLLLHLLFTLLLLHLLLLSLSRTACRQSAWLCAAWQMAGTGCGPSPAENRWAERIGEMNRDEYTRR